MPITNPTINKVFTDLEEFREYCRFEGRPYNEADLYKSDRPVWQAFTKHKNWLKAVARGVARRNA